MNFLFIHGNYPAQFRYLASILAQEKKHRVIFLTKREDAENEAIENVARRDAAASDGSV